MVRKMIQLSETQARRLEQLARREHKSVSELVRQGVDLVLETPSRDQEARRRAARAVGVFSSGDHDVSVRHDEYLAEAYSREHRR